MRTATCRACIGGVLLAGGTASFCVVAASAEAVTFPPVDCVAEQTAGFHDYPAEGERYVPARFHPQAFRLAENTVFMLNLLDSDKRADLYLTLESETTPDASTEPVATELECRQVRGADGSVGYSCVNLPPSEMLLVNARTLRFTRAAVGAWTFAEPAAAESGDSIFVEYGQCRPVAAAGAPAASGGGTDSPASGAPAVAPAGPDTPAPPASRPETPH